jgi:hypothetical protein
MQKALGPSCTPSSGRPFMRFTVDFLAAGDTWPSCGPPVVLRAACGASSQGGPHAHIHHNVLLTL